MGRVLPTPARWRARPLSRKEAHTSDIDTFGPSLKVARTVYRLEGALLERFLMFPHHFWVNPTTYLRVHPRERCFAVLGHLPTIELRSKAMNSASASAVTLSPVVQVARPFHRFPVPWVTWAKNSSSSSIGVMLL